MTHHNLPKNSDSVGSSQQGPEHQTEQARFLAKMQESILGNFKPSNKEKTGTEASAAVRQILQGFVIEDKSKT
ncbi:MAG TPA: hypothetical protein V6C97_12970 [Oculatellaceae cyanobacterium]